MEKRTAESKDAVKEIAKNYGLELTGKDREFQLLKKEVEALKKIVLAGL